MAPSTSGFLQRGRTPAERPAIFSTPGGWHNRLALIASLVLLALAASASGLGNGFAYDDIFIVQKNEHVHSLAWLGFNFVQGYWPREYGGALYRPLTLAAFALQWVLGHGAPWIFHAVNVATYVALTLAVFGLALECLPMVGAWTAAALFAVHPVHVEAVGNVVGQAELTTALVVCLGVWLYIRARRGPELRMRDSIGLFLILVTAALLKENGLILIPLLGTAELILIRDHRPWGRRALAIVPTYLLLALGAVLVLIARRFALGATVGEYPALTLRGLGVWDRCLTMLGIVPEWLRLLLWPAHLRADYGPAEFVGTMQFGSPQAIGLALVVVILATAIATARRRAALAFGIGWTVVALLPVSNILLPTGILLAERTLLLPSVGAALVAGAVVAAIWRKLQAEHQTLQWVAAGALGVLLIVGTLRSAARQRTWRDMPSVVTQLVQDAPLNYRGWMMYGEEMRKRGRGAEARAAMLRGASLYQKDGGVYQELGQLVRFQKGCRQAVPIFRRSLATDPGLYNARGRLYVCLLDLGDSSGAMSVAADGAERGEWFFQLVMARAGQARRVGGDSTPRSP